MNFFRKLFSRSKATSIPAGSVITRALEPANEDLITIYDEFGREARVARDVWRTQILPDSIRSAWNDPTRLYDIVATGFRDGFAKEVADASHRLYELSPRDHGAVCAWAITLMDANKLSESERVLRGYLNEVGQDAAVLGNLSQIYERRAESSRSEELLWKSLEVDPNFSFSFGRFLALHQARAGKDGVREGLRKLALVHRSWRAQLWLAREALEHNHTSIAVEYYREALAHAEQPIPADLLMQMSGDLGNKGELREVLRLTKRWFDASFHGLTVGNNIIKAHVDLGQLSEATEVIQSLYAAQRPDWREHLQFWETTVAKARLEQREVTPASIRMAVTEGPIWLPDYSPAIGLFGSKPTDELVLCMFSGTIETGEGTKPTMGLATPTGRAARAIPLLIAEQLHFHTRARIISAVPTLDVGGFALFGKPYEDVDVVPQARRAHSNCDAAITTHLRPRGDGWDVEVRVFRATDSKVVATLRVEVGVETFAALLTNVANPLITSLETHVGLGRTEPPSLYRLPEASKLNDYMLRLEQLLTIRCVGVDSSAAESGISGEREILRGNMNLCLTDPANPTTRILLAQTVLAISRIAPDILPEFRDLLKKLQSQHPMSSQLQPVIDRMLDEALA